MAKKSNVAASASAAHKATKTQSESGLTKAAGYESSEDARKRLEKEAKKK